MRTGTCREHAQRPKHDIKPNSVKKNRQRRQESGTEPTGKLSARADGKLTAHGSDNRKFGYIEPTGKLDVLISNAQIDCLAQQRQELTALSNNNKKNFTSSLVVREP